MKWCESSSRRINLAAGIAFSFSGDTQSCSTLGAEKFQELCHVCVNLVQKVIKSNDCDDELFVP